MLDLTEQLDWFKKEFKDETEVLSHIQGTHSQHYSKGVETMEFLLEFPMISFAAGNVIKYTSRFPVTQNKKDLLKAIHYCLIERKSFLSGPQLVVENVDDVLDEVRDFTDEFCKSKELNFNLAMVIKSIMFYHLVPMEKPLYDATFYLLKELKNVQETVPEGIA